MVLGMDDTVALHYVEIQYVCMSNCEADIQPLEHGTNC